MATRTIQDLCRGAVGVEEQQCAALAAAQERLAGHPLNAAVDSVPRLAWFMETHVFAVWDCMSLLKRMQRDFTCLDVPWLPVSDTRAAQFVNELVCDAESGSGPTGRPMSYLDLYLCAMDEVGADTETFRRFLVLVRQGKPVGHALRALQVSGYVAAYVRSTLELVREGSSAAVAGALLLGRSQPLPRVFSEPHALFATEADAPHLFLCARRHGSFEAALTVDSARRMLESIAGDEPARWAEVVDAAREAVSLRLALWDGILSSLD